MSSKFGGWMAVAIGAWSVAGPAGSDVPLESIGRVEVLDRPYDAHWLWAADALGSRLSLIDLEDGAFLGQLNSGWGMPSLLFPRSRAEIYVPETFFARGARGARTDVASIYDSQTLAPISEVVLPPKRAINPLPTGNAALSDDDRFLAVFNMNPATSLSIVDLPARSLTAEIFTPGCSLAYAAGPRRFATLCADGAMLVIELDDAGQLLRRIRSEPFFDPEADPVTEKAQRWGDKWVFVSFEGFVHTVDFSQGEPRFESPWSLFAAADREARWRIGGLQHLALHQASGRLYSLVHRGGVDTHKDSGTEVWVYDLATQSRVDRIELHNPAPSVMGYPIEFGPSWLFRFTLDRLLPRFGVDLIAVTQDDEPLLLSGAKYTGGVCVYDARSGELLRRLFTGNMTVQGLFTQPRRAAAAGSTR